MKKVAFYTLGCKVNQYETEAVAELFEAEDYELVSFEEKADVYVINTCTVTSMSDRKSRQAIRKAKKNNEHAVVVVIGCYAQTSPEEVRNIPGVNLVIGTKDRNKIINYLDKFKAVETNANYVVDIANNIEFEKLNVKTYKEHARAFIKIQDGCNQYCTYCIIPYARGPIRSKRPEDVLNEARELGEKGFKEIVLTGIHIASYGKDIKTTSLMDIIERVHGVEGVERIRIGSIEPNIVTSEFIEEAKNLRKLCPHYHLSLQSGCDRTLKRMNRKYTTEDYKKVVALLRENVPDVAITTDIMVGFPGETDEEFETTYRFLEEISFAKMHVFKYSARKGTPAASFREQIPPEIKEVRSRRLIELSYTNTLNFNRSYIGRVMPVLFEQEKGNGFIEGLTMNYIRVVCKGDKALKGEISAVELDALKDDFTYGLIVKK